MELEHRSCRAGWLGALAAIACVSCSPPADPITTTFEPLILQEDQRVGPSSDGDGDTTQWDFFGTSVALSGDTALVGAPSDDAGDNVWQGAAYVYVRSGGAWIKHAKLRASDGDIWDSFGFAVDLSGDTALVGAPGANTGPTLEPGAAYGHRRS